MTPSPPTQGRPLFEIKFDPTPAPAVQLAPAKYSAEILHPECTITGWLLPPEKVSIRGIRAVLSGHFHTARRKQLRPDVSREHPQRPEALHSGFVIKLPLRAGLNRVVIQFKDEHKAWHTLCVCELRLPWLWRVWRRWNKTLPKNDYERWIHERESQEKQAAVKGGRPEGLKQIGPLISVLMPVHNTPARWLRRVIDSVRAQTYPNWELCIADDCSAASHVAPLLRQAARTDNRIKVTFREQNGHICHASNSALELCSGEFTALLDHDDELPQDALFHLAKSIVAEPEVDLLFSDEDKIDEQGKRSDPYFKMGWNYDLLLQQNCFSHLGVFRTSILREIGGFRPGFEGSQDWDLTLRAIERVPRNRIRHIPKVLYHWRTLESSTASSINAKPYAFDAGMKAVASHLERRNVAAQLIQLEGLRWQVKWPLPTPAPLVSIILPTRDRVELLRVALESLRKMTDYQPYEIIVVDHESVEKQTHAYLEDLQREAKNVRVIKASGPFNWSRLNNLGAKTASGDVLLFLNNDVEVTDAGWLRELVSQACRTEVGAVGACLLYPDLTIQHAGVVLGMTGVAGHVFRKSGFDHPSIGGLPFLVREVTAVTGACLAVRRAHFDRAGGFDEENLPVNYNDIDFCLRLRSMGLQNIYTSHARLIHHESLSRAALEKESARKAAASEEAKIILSRWPKEFAGDAFYNPNLSRDSEWPLLK